MARTEKAIFTVLVLVENEQGQILVENRVDASYPGICLPGGHVEAREAFTDAAVRETLEETGLKIEDPILCGVKQFQTEKDERYVVFFYKATKFSGTLSSSDEGEVFWISREHLSDYKTVSDLNSMLKVFDSPELSEFIYRDSGSSWKLELL